MPVQIDGEEYFTHSEVSEELAVSRQTLWRWREKGQVPRGLRAHNRLRRVCVQMFRAELGRPDIGTSRCALSCLMNPNLQGSGGCRLRLFSASRDLSGPAETPRFGFRF